MALVLPRGLAITATRVLSTVDYTVANRVTEDVAEIVEWAYRHDLPRLASASVVGLQFFDSLGSVLIALAVWIVTHTT